MAKMRMFAEVILCKRTRMVWAEIILGPKTVSACGECSQMSYSVNDAG